MKGFTYDALNRLTQKQGKSSPTVIARARSARSNLYAAARRFFRGVEDTFVGRAYAATVLPPGVKLNFLHGDHLGSINLVTDHTGKQMELDEYSPTSRGPPPSGYGGWSVPTASSKNTSKRSKSRAN